MGKLDVWTMHKSKRVLITDEPGVPTEMLGFVSQAAADAAGARGFATVSELGFSTADHADFDDWREARKYAEPLAEKLGYRVEEQTLEFGDVGDWPDDDFGDDFDEQDDDWDEGVSDAFPRDDDEEDYDYAEGDIGQDGEI